MLKRKSITVKENHDDFIIPIRISTDPSACVGLWRNCTNPQSAA